MTTPLQVSRFALAAALLLSCSSAAHAVIVVDSFQTNQSSLTLTFPPAGTSASSSASGAGILGGERDVQVSLTSGVIAGNTVSTTVSSGFFSYSQDATISGRSEIQWDGADGSATLNPTGLGGIDLTDGGILSQFLLTVLFDDLPADGQIAVYSNAANFSVLNFNLPGLIFSTTSFEFDFSDFTIGAGTGADFTDVGAIVLSIGSSVTAPDVVIDSFTVVPEPASASLIGLGMLAMTARRARRR